MTEHRYISPSKAFFQAAPTQFVEGLPRHRHDSWVKTDLGYRREAEKRVQCLNLNRKLLGHDYTWHVVVSVDAEVHPKELNKWRAAAWHDLGKKGVVAFWVVEVARDTNHCHYHLLLSSHHDGNPAAIIKSCLPSYLPSRVHTERVKSQGTLPRYILKAKQSGKDRTTGEWSKDKWASERLLFKPNLGHAKCGKIGNFWVKPFKQLWKMVCEREERIADALELGEVREKVRGVWNDLLGGKPVVVGKRLVTRRTLERNFASQHSQE